MSLDSSSIRPPGGAHISGIPDLQTVDLGPVAGRLPAASQIDQQLKTSSESTEKHSRLKELASKAGDLFVKLVKGFAAGAVSSLLVVTIPFAILASVVTVPAGFAAEALGLIKRNMEEVAPPPAPRRAVHAEGESNRPPVAAAVPRQQPQYQLAQGDIGGIDYGLLFALAPTMLVLAAAQKILKS